LARNLALVATALALALPGPGALRRLLVPEARSTSAGAFGPT
jgi:hypothetical protein